MQKPLELLEAAIQELEAAVDKGILDPSITQQIIERLLAVNSKISRMEDRLRSTQRPNES